MWQSGKDAGGEQEMADNKDVGKEREQRRRKNAGNLSWRVHKWISFLNKGDINKYLIMHMYEI